ncbi:hypothetical protein ScPMuIL_013335 [Solemya velum]
MSNTTPATDIFAAFRSHLEAEQELREEIRVVVRELEQTAREIQTELQAVHQQNGIKNISVLCEKSYSMFDVVREQLTKLSQKIPLNQYYRFHDHWRFVIQRLSFLAAFLKFLQSEQLISREDTANLLGVKVDKNDGFQLDLEDYLMGLLTLSNELARLAVNSVTAGDCFLPVKIAKFVGELDSGFRLLNLKNDSLRKRFDGLKYDLKKVEEIVYDLTIRGLKPKDGATGDIN